VNDVHIDVYPSLNDACAELNADTRTVTPSLVWLEKHVCPNGKVVYELGILDPWPGQEEIIPAGFTNRPDPR
jgi:hypothetical protein